MKLKFILNTYFLISFSILLSIGYWIFNQPFLFAFSTFLSGITGLVLLLRIFLYIEQEFSFPNLLVSSILISTGLGTFNTYNSFNSIADWEFFLGIRGISSTATVATAHLFVMLFCLSIMFLGGFFYKRLLILTKKLIYQTIAIVQHERLMKIILIFSFLFSALQIFLIASGQIGFLSSGLANITDVGKQVRPEISVVISIIPLMSLILGVNLWKIALNRSSTLSEIIFYYFIAVTQIIWVITLGLRREISYSFLLFCFGLRIAFPKINGFIDRKQVRKAISVLLSILVVSYIAIQVTTFSRIIANSSSYASLSFFERITFLAENFINYNTGHDSVLKEGLFEEKSSQNFETRTFVLSGLALMIAPVDQKSPLMGIELRNSMIKSVPGAILPEKYLFSTQETLYSEKFALPIQYLKDIAESIYLSAYIDFSWLGMFIYPSILLGVFNFLIPLIQGSNLKIFKILSVSNLSYLCFSAGENNIISYFGTIRDLLMYFVLFYFFRFLLKKQ